MGKQHIGADAIGFQHFSGSAVRLPGQSQQNMSRLHLPLSLMSGLPGGKPQDFSGRPGKALGQGQGLVPPAIQEDGKGLGAFALQSQAPQQLSRLPGGLSQGQQQMHRPYIAVPHAFGQSGACPNELQCARAVVHVHSPFSAGSVDSPGGKYT